MFDFLRNLFDGIFNFFDSVWRIITDAINNIVQFFKVLSPTVSFVTGLFKSLPPLFLTFGVIMVIVLILYVILGRQAGGD